MLHKTPGIVLGYIKYGETSIIARIFTAFFGKQTYIIQGVRSRKAKYSIALFQPLMPLDMVVYHKKTANMQRIAEVRCHVPISNILGDLKKATIATFLSELLSKVLYEEEHNEALFSFLLESIVAFNEQDTDYEYFHLTFMLQLSRYLGFGIKAAQDMDVQLYRSGFHTGFNQTEIDLLDTLLSNPFKQIPVIKKATIRKLTTTIINYYQLHIDNLGTLKSLKVLQEIGN
jgi:DNA repair protein RecO (recombination protein O)